MVNVGGNEIMNELHEANRKQWNAAADWWQKRTEQRGIWKRCHQEPSLVLTPSELSVLQDIRGTSACVLGSGDNEVVFALAGMGAAVTSVDISEHQLQIASRRAEILGLKISFLRADISDLAEIKNAEFDYVYTGGHISVWLSDIQKYYSEAVRILKCGGCFIVNDYHPFRRIWKDGSKEFVLADPYFKRGPFRYQSGNGFPQFEFHWTVADHVQAMLSAGCELLMMEETGDRNDDWNETELAGLPQYLLLVGKKRTANKAVEPTANAPGTRLTFDS